MTDQNHNFPNIEESAFVSGISLALCPINTDQQTVVAPKKVNKTPEKRNRSSDRREFRKSPLSLAVKSKKKTIAFGKTVNLSQTIESIGPQYIKSGLKKMAQNAISVNEFEQLKAVVEEHSTTVFNLTKKMASIENLETTVQQSVKQMCEIKEMLTDMINKNGERGQKKRTPVARNLDKGRVVESQKNHHNNNNTTSSDDILRMVSAVGDLFQPNRKSSSPRVDFGRLVEKADENDQLRAELNHLLIKYGEDDSLVLMQRGIDQRKRVDPRYSNHRHRTSMTLRDEHSASISCYSPFKSMGFSVDSRRFLERHEIRRKVDATNEGRRCDCRESDDTDEESGAEIGMDRHDDFCRH